MDLIARRQVEKILRDPFEGDREWSIQGLGMLRTYLGEDRVTRLHVWGDAAKSEGASELHTHPWDMTSMVIAGQLVQERYVAFNSLEGTPTHMQQKILCGEGGGLCGLPEAVELRQAYPEIYSAGHSYQQKWWEIHRTVPMNGTVTVIRREFTSDPDHAYVYWPKGEQWVTAEPRTAKLDEIWELTAVALENWFS